MLHQLFLKFKIRNIQVYLHIAGAAGIFKLHADVRYLVCKIAVVQRINDGARFSVGVRCKGHVDGAAHDVAIVQCRDLTEIQRIIDGSRKNAVQLNEQLAGIVVIRDGRGVARGIDFLELLLHLVHIYRKWSVAGLAAAAVFMGCMAGLMSMIVKTEGAKVPTIVLFAAFIIYTAVSVVCAVLGVKSYVKDDCGVCLFQGIVHIYSVIACVMNVRMAFIILFSALGSRSGVDTLIGSQSQNEFIQSQYASWICLAIATLFSVILGILAVVWLVKNKKN